MKNKSRGKNDRIKTLLISFYAKSVKNLSGLELLVVY